MNISIIKALSIFFFSLSLSLHAMHNHSASQATSKSQEASKELLNLLHRAPHVQNSNITAAHQLETKVKELMDKGANPSYSGSVSNGENIYGFGPHAKTYSFGSGKSILNVAKEKGYTNIIKLFTNKKLN